MNFFLNKFKKLGFIEYNGEKPDKINSSLLSVTRAGRQRTCELSFQQADKKNRRVVRTEMSVMIKKTIWVLLAVAVLAFVLGTTVRAQQRNKQSVQLPEPSKAVVPAIALDVTPLSLTDLQTLPIVAVPPDVKDAAIVAVIQTRALPNVAALVSAVRTARVMHPVQ